MEQCLHLGKKKLCILSTRKLHILAQQKVVDFYSQKFQV